MFPDPYIQPKVDWRPIIICFSTIGGVFLILILPLLFFALLKSKARKKERLLRRTDMRKTLRSSRASLATNRTMPSGRGMQDDIQQQKRRRPPLRPGGMETSFLDLSGVTLDDTSTDTVAKAKMDFHRPGTPASLLDSSSGGYSHSKLDSSYFDSDLGPVQQSSRDYGDSYRPPRLENEISYLRHPTGGAAAMYNDAFDDDRSVARSQLKSASSQGGSPPYSRRQGQFPYPSTGGAGYVDYSHSPSAYSGYSQRQRGGEPSSGSTSQSQGYVKPPRPRPKESAM